MIAASEWQMTKHKQKKGTFVPHGASDMVPKLERNAKIFNDDVDGWVSSWDQSYCGPHGKEFTKWCESVVNKTRQTLCTLFCRYGILPSLILEVLEYNKHLFLKDKDLESGGWIEGVPKREYGYARDLIDDSRESKILRNGKLVERNARAVEKAAQVLIDMPHCLSEIDDMPEPLLLSDKLYAIAKRIRESRKKQRHRPQLRAAWMVVTDLTRMFKWATGNPLYAYAGILTKTCFPEEWNPGRDEREAAKKLVKSHERISQRTCESESFRSKKIGLQKLDALASLIHSNKARTVRELVKRVPDFGEFVAGCRRLRRDKPNPLRQLQKIITQLSKGQISDLVWERLTPYMKTVIVEMPL
jgi:hypothetical protein